MHIPCPVSYTHLDVYKRQAYIYRENTISSVIGVLVGLVAGVFLEKFVIFTAEVDMVMFAPDIALSCFAVSYTHLFGACRRFGAVIASYGCNSFGTCQNMERLPSI